MQNTNLSKMAGILVNYSTEVKPGQDVLIHFYDEVAIPLVKKVVEKVVMAGANPQVVFQPFWLDYAILNRGSSEQIAQRFIAHQLTVRNCQAYIGIGGLSDPDYLKDIKPDKVQLRHYRSFLPDVNHRVNNLRWVITRYPTKAMAKKAGMSFKKYEDFFCRAINKDWFAFSKEIEAKKPTFDNKKEVKIEGRNIDMTLSLEGRYGKPCVGLSNMPDGELCYAPIEESVNGHVTYEWPMELMEKEVRDISLLFKDGRVADASATLNEDALFQVLNSDEGSRFVGEFGLGLNYDIDRYISNTLFDEKIGGTIHLALGHPCPDTGGVNKSEVHEDMVKDLRQDGRIYVEGKLVFKNGKYLI